ncbi:hypothetical protein BpHYR1_046378 [Brachionus plicatilis]|uniref:Uncharacterized protein n=1 Tax=Brachionus plicatilis TaxID=10195 RepID=A0A3M7PPM3_BRAPC|nr:hypothetical protein BpHYR1_046378 [Brachionus plicatilis]
MSIKLDNQKKYLLPFHLSFDLALTLWLLNNFGCKNKILNLLKMCLIPFLYSSKILDYDEDILSRMLNISEDEYKIPFKINNYLNKIIFSKLNFSSSKLKFMIKYFDINKELLIQNVVSIKIKTNNKIVKKSEVLENDHIQ